jgi:hypothetical protein
MCDLLGKRGRSDQTAVTASHFRPGTGSDPAPMLPCRAVGCGRAAGVCIADPESCGQPATGLRSAIDSIRTAMKALPARDARPRSMGLAEALTEVPARRDDR